MLLFKVQSPTLTSTAAVGTSRVHTKPLPASSTQIHDSSAPRPKQSTPDNCWRSLLQRVSCSSQKIQAGGTHDRSVVTNRSQITPADPCCHRHPRVSGSSKTVQNGKTHDSSVVTNQSQITAAHPCYTVPLADARLWLQKGEKCGAGVVKVPNHSE